MSDFDKEAERERLRKKYERDKQDREATKRMSDLLLKGATMTNAHCGTCGDPLFEQNDVRFCPTCHGDPSAVEGSGISDGEPASEAETDGSTDTVGTEVDEPTIDDQATSKAGTGTRAEAGTGSRAKGADDTRSDTSEATSANAPNRSQSAPDPDGTPTTDDTTDPVTDTPSTSHTSDPTGRPTGANEATDSVEDAPVDRETAPRTEATTGTTRAGAIDSDNGHRNTEALESARESLTRALTSFAHEAAETDDPRYATACLKAAREASETLVVLRDA